MKKATIAMLSLAAITTGLFTGCATSPVAECISTEAEIAPVAEYATPVQIVREAPLRETVIERSSSSISPQRCF